MKNKLAQIRSLNTAFQNTRKDKDEDRKKRKEINPTYDGRHHHGTFKKVEDVQEDAPANSISTGGPVAGHDNIPLGHKMMRRVKEVPVTDRRYKLNSSKANTLKKKYRGKELLLTTFKKHAYGK
tara:strand:+ start:4819 stop:5190 length:372 start_codon:yes stop_codon:yes gene_type:complete